RAGDVQPLDTQNVSDGVIAVGRRVALLIYHGDETVQLVVDVVDAWRLCEQSGRHDHGAEHERGEGASRDDEASPVGCGHKSVRTEARPTPLARRVSSGPWAVARENGHRISC